MELKVTLPVLPRSRGMGNEGWVDVAHLGSPAGNVPTLFPVAIRFKSASVEKCRVVMDAMGCSPLRWMCSRYCSEVLISNSLNPMDPKTPSYSSTAASIRPIYGGEVQSPFEDESQESMSV